MENVRPARISRHRYIFEDPIRFTCLCSAALLVFVREVPFALTLIVVLVTQLAPVAMMARASMPGWSRRWGRSVRESIVASNLSMDFVNLSACSVVGALLLVRHFNGAEVVRPLGILAGAICLAPDARLCRWVLAGDPVAASRRLRDGFNACDPVLLGAIAASATVCLLDPVSLLFVMLSLGLLQFNTLLVFLDKYVPEIETRRFSGWAAVVLEREARRVALCLAPLALVPLRLYAGDGASYYGAGAIAAAVVAPDLARASAMALRWGADLFRVTPAPPATLIVLPRPH